MNIGPPLRQQGRAFCLSCAAAFRFLPKKSAKPLPYLVHLCYNTSIYAAFAAETGG